MLVIALFWVVIYFVPTIIAFRNNKKDAGLIFVLNFFIGFTVIGWIILLAWSTEPDRKPESSFQGFDSNSITAPVTVDSYGYKVRYRVMNNSEESFFCLLQKEVGAEYYIFPKMRIADILETEDGDGYYKRRNKVLPKHIDFLICDTNFRPKIGIEIDGSSHRRPERIERDNLVDAIFESAGLTLVHVHVGSSFVNEIQKIMERLKT